eukprot:sb/3465607/
MVCSESSVWDRLIRAQLSFYESLMGVYLGIVLGANTYYDNTYCLNDYKWRSGGLCKAMGVLFSASSHGSLITSLLLAISRARSGDKPGPGTYITGIFLTIPVVCQALLPIANHGIMSDTFRIWARMNPDNPFWQVAKDPTVNWNPANLQKIYDNFVEDNKSNPTVVSMVESLTSLTSIPDTFSYQDLHYYGSSPLCTGDPLKGGTPLYRTIYLSTLSLVLSLFILRMLCCKITTRGDGNEEEQWPVEANVRLGLIAATKLGLWVFRVCVMVWCLLRDEDPLPGIECAVLVVLPLSCVERKLWRLRRGLGELPRGREVLDLIPWMRCCKPTDTSKRPIRTHYLGHVTGNQPIRNHMVERRGTGKLRGLPIVTGPGPIDEGSGVGT